jgi:cytochrome c oxidase subunit 4
MELLLVLGVAFGLLLLAIAMAAPLAFAFKWISPLPPIKPEPERAEPVEEVDEAVLTGRRAAYQRGLFVFVGLAVLTLIEFGIAIWIGSVIFLFLIALLKAGLILQYYMHLGKVWGGEEVHA